MGGQAAHGGVGGKEDLGGQGGVGGVGGVGGKGDLGGQGGHGDLGGEGGLGGEGDPGGQGGFDGLAGEGGVGGQGGTHPPLAGPDTVSTNEDVAVTIDHAYLLANDTDVDGPALSVSGAGAVTHGTLSFDEVDGTITFTPEHDYFGPASFQYTVTDGTTPSVGTVSVTVNPVNDAPVAVVDAAVTDEDNLVQILEATLIGNDTDVDGPSPLQITAVSEPTGGTIAFDGTTVAFTPFANSSGTGGYDYTVSDGDLSATTHVTITVKAVDDPPLALDDTANTVEDVAVTIDVLANDTDVDGPPLALKSVSNRVNGTAVLNGGQIDFFPDAGFEGEASFDYLVEAGPLSDTGHVVVKVAPVIICGDGQIQGAEECDDALALPGDGCSTNCTEEAGWECSGEPSVCSEICGDGLLVGDEQCDDADNDETDGCTTSCVNSVLCNGTEYPGGDTFAVAPNTGHCYVGYDAEPTTFSAASTACAAAGGTLATLTSAQEQAFAHGAQTPGQNPWIGAVENEIDTDDVFVWVTGEPWGYRHFASGEPDDDAASSGKGECLHLVNDAGEWNDTDCDFVGFVSGRLCEFDFCGDGSLQDGEECDDGNGVSGDGCSSSCTVERLFFSEYVEGSGNNKAVEIKNPFSTARNLTGTCSVQIAFNGGSAPTTTINLAGTVAGGDVFVLCNNSTVSPQCDQNSTSLTFNGDDTVLLVCNATRLDAIGDLGSDPGTQWVQAGVANNSTEDNTIRRRCTYAGGAGVPITHGDTLFDDDFNIDLAQQWQGFAIDTVAGLGSPACVP